MPFPLRYSQMNCQIENEYISGLSHLNSIIRDSNRKGIQKRMPSPKLRPLKFKYFILGWNHWILFRGLGASGLPPLCDWFLASFKKGLVKKSIVGLNGRKNVREAEGEKKKTEKKNKKKRNQQWKNKTKKKGNKITLKSAGVLYFGGRY